MVRIQRELGPQPAGTTRSHPPELTLLADMMAASLAEVARELDMNENLLHKWERGRCARPSDRQFPVSPMPRLSLLAASVGQGSKICEARERNLWL